MGPQSNPTLAFSCHKSRLMRGQGVKLSMLTAFAVAKKGRSSKSFAYFLPHYILMIHLPTVCVRGGLPKL